MPDKDYIPSSRLEAKRLGSRTYYTGTPCPQGHNAERYTGRGSCVECANKVSRDQVECGYYRKRYQRKAPEILRQQRERYASLREVRQRVRKHAAKWARDNPDRVSAIKSNYKHRRRANEDGGISSADLAVWVVAQKKVCYWCGDRCPDDYTVDHYEPLSKGGKHEAENLVIACRTCNVRKNARDPYAFAQSVGRLF